MTSPDHDLPQLLLTISRDFEPRLLQELRRRGHEALRLSFARFLYLVWDEARPLGAIGDELGLSRQAASQLATRIERAGYIERRPNPEDGRSKLISVTAQGRAVDDQRAQDAIAACHAHYASIVGDDDLAIFVASLIALREADGAPQHPVGAPRSLGVLPLVALQTRDDLLTLVRGRRNATLTPAQLDTLLSVRRDGIRPSDLAREQGVTRQAASSVLRELEGDGYLTRRTDESDHRSVILMPSTLGDQMLDAADAAAGELEDGFRSALGAAGLEDLRRICRRLRLQLQPAGPPDLVALATSLQRQLGATDAARLGSLLSGADT